MVLWVITVPGKRQTDTFSKNHRVIAYSLRYMYPNKQILDSAADYSLSQNIKDLIELIKALKLEPVHLVGIHLEPLQP